MLPCTIIDNFLDEQTFENMYSFFHFQHEFLNTNKNYWFKLNDSFFKNVYKNDEIIKASSPASCVRKLQTKISEPTFLSNLVNHDVKNITVMSVKQYGLMMASGSQIKKHVDYPFPHNTGEIVLKMIYFGHRVWDDSWHGKLELWEDNIIKEQVKCIPNRLVAFVSNDQSYHSISHIPDLPNKCYHNSIVFNVKLSIENC